MIETKSEGKTTRITVCSYGNYDTRRRQSDDEATPRRRRHNAETATVKKDNKVKKEKKRKVSPSFFLQRVFIDGL